MAGAGKELRTLRIISAAMIGGVLVFLAVALLMRQSLQATGGLNLVAYLAAGWAVLSVPIADVLRGARWPTSAPEQDPLYWKRRGAAHLVSMGLVEGGALLCCVSLMITTTWWPLAAILVPLAAMAAWFPRDA